MYREREREFMQISLQKEVYPYKKKLIDPIWNLYNTTHLARINKNAILPSNPV